jgi:leucyl-tRNA synthetase
MRFTDPHNDAMPFDPQQAAYWLPVDTYVGGAEHAVMHLLYSRFWTKALYDLGYVTFIEPFMRLRNQGMILSPQMRDGKYEKMSKSKGNVITPDEVVAQYGADALRAYEMFISEFSQATPWQIDGLAGTFRWLQRVWTLVLEGQTKTRDLPPASAEQIKVLRRALHQTLKKVEDDIDAFAFNTVISSLMEFTNTLARAKETALYPDAVWDEIVDTLLRILAPIAPFMAEELWKRRGNEYSIHQQEWPRYDAAIAAEESFTLVVQVNGKVRARLELPVGIREDEVKAKAFADAGVKKYSDGKTLANVVYVPGRLLNIVVK